MINTKLIKKKQLKLEQRPSVFLIWHFCLVLDYTSGCVKLYN